MGNLAFVGSHSINGVSALHTELMKETVFADLHKLYPDRINNKTNGITPRRWLMQCNPGPDRADRARRSATASSTTPKQLTALDALRRRRRVPASSSPRSSAPTRSGWRSSSQERIGITVRSRSALFDVQIKRIHEYKRQLLNIIEAVALYDQIRAHPERDWVPRVKILRRQGGAELPQRQADHQAGQRRRPGHQPRPGGARPAEGRVRAELQCQPGRDASSRRPTCPSRSRRPAWKPRAPAT